jgi:hypothetical protein
MFTHDESSMSSILLVYRPKLGFNLHPHLSIMVFISNFLIALISKRLCSDTFFDLGYWKHELWIFP